MSSLGAVALLVEAHAACTQLLSHRTGQYTGGLSALSRVARQSGHICAATARRIERLDMAVAHLRRASRPRNEAFLQALVVELGVDPQDTDQRLDADMQAANNILLRKTPPHGHAQVDAHAGAPVRHRHVPAVPVHEVATVIEVWENIEDEPNNKLAAGSQPQTFDQLVEVSEVPVRGALPPPLQVPARPARSQPSPCRVAVGAHVDESGRCHSSALPSSAPSAPPAPAASPQLPTTAAYVDEFGRSYTPDERGRIDRARASGQLIAEPAQLPVWRPSLPTRQDG